MADLIDRERLLLSIDGAIASMRQKVGNDITLNAAVDLVQIQRDFIAAQTAVDAVEVSADELKYLINDTIAYIWRMEDSGRDKSEFGYDERKALLEKLKRFKKEHFPEMRCCGERRGENAAD